MWRATDCGVTRYLSPSVGREFLSVEVAARAIALKGSEGARVAGLGVALGDLLKRQGVVRVAACRGLSRQVAACRGLHVARIPGGWSQGAALSPRVDKQGSLAIGPPIRPPVFYFSG